LAAVSFGFAPAAHAARCNDRLPLHPGSCGPRVKDLQWLLGGHRPNVFTEVKGTFKHQPNGAYGARTKAALFSYRFRIGYPSKGQCGARTSEWQSVEVTGYLFNVLKGKARRPACWVALAASRLKAVVAAQPSKTALAWKQLVVSQLGVTEQPNGSNRGPRISYQSGSYPSYQSSTGAYGAAWCVSFEQWAAQVIGYGHFAQDTAGVYYAADFYSARSMTFAKPKLGSLVAFITYDRYGHRVPGTGHMGFVVAVQASSFTYVAGNDSNGVREHTIPDGSRPYLFIRLAGVA
jgi:hypothetical protein